MSRKGRHRRATNFSVVRVKRDVLRRSSVGLIFTGRSNIEGGTASNQVYGVDGTFAFFANLAINTYWARTQTDGIAGDDTSYRAQLDYAGDRYGVLLERLVIGDTFNPDVGYVRRNDIRLSQAQFRFSPRPDAPVESCESFRGPASWPIRKTAPGASRHGICEGEFGIEFQNSDTFAASYGDAYEFLPGPCAHRRHHDSRWRLRLRDDACRLQLRTAARNLRQCLRRERGVLQRPQDDAIDQPGTGQRHAATVD